MSERIDRLVHWVTTIAIVVLAPLALRREFRGGEVVTEAAVNQSQPDSIPGWEKAREFSLALGNPSGEIEIIVAGDIECPACRSTHHSIKKHVELDPASHRVDYLHFPLRQHRLAIPAAAFVECARESGRGQDALDKLYDQQDSLGIQEWEDLARAVGVPKPRLIRQCMSREEVLERVMKARTLGEQLGVRFTPTIFVNGWRLPRVPSHADLAELIAWVKTGKRPRLEDSDKSSVAVSGGGGAR